MLRLVSKRFSRVLRSFTICIGLAVALLLVLPTSGARADKNMDMAVDLFVWAGQFAGVPLTKEQVAFARSFIGCVAQDNPVPVCSKEAVVSALLKNAPAEATQLLNCVTSLKNVVGCGTDVVLDKIPEQARPMARCMLEGGDAVDCGKKLVIGTLMEQVPEKARPITECLVGGGNVAKCAQDEALRNIPNADARNVAACVLGGTPVDKCGSRALIGTLPKDVQDVVKCVGDTGDVAGCGKKLAIDQLPAGKARDFANCLNTPGKNEAQCAAQYGIGVLDPAAKKATDEALAAAKQVEQQMAEMTAKMPNLVQNIMKVAEGIRKEDWGLIIEGGVPEIAKLAAKIIIEIILTPAIAPIAGPVIDAMIETKSDAFFGLIKAINDGDAVKVAAVIAEYFATMAIAIPCALVPAGDFHDAVCGNLAKGIAKAIEFGTGVAKDIIELGEDIAKLIGVYDIAKEAVGFVGDAWEGIKDAFDDLFGGGDGSTVTRRCVGMSPTQFYGQNYLACMKSQMDGPAPASVVQACHTAMWRCGIDNTASLCGTMNPNGTVTPGTFQNQFDAFKNRIKATYPAGAENYTAQAFGAYAQSKGEAICDDDNWAAMSESFVGQCAATIDQQAKIADNNCSTGNIFKRSTNAARSACVGALGRVDRVKVTWDQCAGYRKKKEEWDQKVRPCAEANLKVGHEAGNPYVDLKKPFNLDECLGKINPKGWIPPILSLPGYTKWNPGLDVFNFNPGRTLPGILIPGYVTPGDTRLSPGFVTGSCKPGVPMMMAMMSPPRTLGDPLLKINLQIRIPNEALPSCNTGTGRGGWDGINWVDDNVLRRMPPLVNRPQTATPTRPAVVNTPNPVGGGRPYTSRQPAEQRQSSGSAMDRLPSGSSLDTVRGANVGFDGGGRPHPPKPCTTCAPKSSGAAKPGGSGGIGMVGGSSGNTPSQKPGSTSKTSQPQQQAQPKPKPQQSAPPSAPFGPDYGGCSGCNPKKDPVVVR